MKEQGPSMLSSILMPYERIIYSFNKGLLRGCSTPGTAPGADSRQKMQTRRLIRGANAVTEKSASKIVHSIFLFYCVILGCRCAMKELKWVCRIGGLRSKELLQRDLGRSRMTLKPRPN